VQNSDVARLFSEKQLAVNSLSIFSHGSPR
jgi:hypothetical protein